MCERLFGLLDKLAGRWLNWHADHVYHSDDPAFAVGITKVEFTKERGLEIMGTAPNIVYLADECTELLKKFNAENYIQFDMMPRLDRGRRPVRVTVSFANGEMPAMKAARLDKKVEAIKTAVSKLVEYREQNTSNFQLEKLDDYIRELQTACMEGEK